MSPLDSNKQVPNLRGEDGEGSVQVQMDPKLKIDGAKVFAVYGLSLIHISEPTRR